MANRIEGLDDKIIKHAKVEFLEKGYINASLRTISKNANTSTSTIYTRYCDKEGLFSRLVKEVADEFENKIMKYLKKFENLSIEEQRDKYYDFSDDVFLELIDYIYDNFDTFKILIVCSLGSSYENYIDRIVEIDSKYMKLFSQIMNIHISSSEEITDNFFHMISSSFYNGFFEIVMHDMPKNEAIKHIKRLRKFYISGWQSFTNPD